MNLLWSLLRASRGVVLLAMLAGLLSAAADARLLALIHAALGDQETTAALAWTFAGLWLAVMGTRFVCQTLLFRLSQAVVYRMCLTLSERILATPLRRIEELGAHRFLATLTQDVVVVANGLLAVP